MNISTSALVRVTGLRQLLQFLIEFGTTVTVARLMTPAEIGTFSVAMAAIVLAMALRNAGVQSYVLQSRSLGPAEVGATLGFATVTNLTLGAAVVAAAPWIARVYEAPVIVPLLLVVGLTFLTNPIQMVASSLLSRDLQMGRLAIASLAGSAAGAGVTLTFAYTGAGPMSMAWGALARAVVGMAMLSALAPRLLWCRPRFSGWGEVASISGWSLATTLLLEVQGRMAELVIGRTLGLDNAALMERARSLPRLLWSHLMPPVLGILAPVVASERRGGFDIRYLTVRRMRFFGCVFVPILAGMSTQSEHLILGLFGDQWTGAVEPARWVCISSAIGGQFIVINTTLFAMGRTKHVFFCTLISLLSTLVVLALFANVSISAVARGGVGSAFVGATAIYVAGRINGVIRFADLPRALRPGLLTGGTIFLLGYVLEALLAHNVELSHLATLAVVIPVLGLVLSLLLVFLEPDVLRFAWKVVTQRPAPR